MYREGDHALPYAKYFRATTRPLQDHVREALVAGMAPTEYGYGVDEVARRLQRTGYENLETGWTRLESGLAMVAVHTTMPEVTAAMWDWWFGWHSRESARYKLWFPDAHRFAALGEDRGGDRTLTDKQRYVDNVSYVDEYIGGRLYRLAIRFFDPGRLGFEPAPESTVVCARVGFSQLPVVFGWVVHQVRPTPDGCEMRSRFFLNDPAILGLPSRALSGVGARALASSTGRLVARPFTRAVASQLLPASIGTDMIFHCAAEMNHLAGVLAPLYHEFRDLP